MALLEQTNQLLDSARLRKISLRSLALTSDGQVEYDWLKRFAKGEIDDPSVNRIQCLHDHLRSTLGRKRA